MCKSIMYSHNELLQMISMDKKTEYNVLKIIEGIKNERNG